MRFVDACDPPTIERLSPVVGKNQKNLGDIFLDARLPAGEHASCALGGFNPRDTGRSGVFLPGVPRELHPLAYGKDPVPNLAARVAAGSAIESPGLVGIIAPERIPHRLRR